MKSKIAIIGLVLLMSSLIPVESFAQKRPGPPPWAGAQGYRAQARYVYFPQHNFYYDMHRNIYVYADGPHWQMAPALPSLYAWINLGNSTQVVLDYYGDLPYRENHYHVERYHYKEHHKVWKKQHREWEKQEREWTKEYNKRHKKCGHHCNEVRYVEARPVSPPPPARRVRVDVRF